MASFGLAFKSNGTKPMSRRVFWGSYFAGLLIGIPSFIVWLV